MRNDISVVLQIMYAGTAVCALANMYLSTLLECTHQNMRAALHAMLCACDLYPALVPAEDRIKPS